MNRALLAAASLLLLAASAAAAAQVCALGTLAVVETQHGCHGLSAVVLDGRKRPVVAGTVCLTKSAALHQLVRHGDHVIAQLWNHLEVYSFADPRAPRLVRTLVLDETHPSWGGGGIVREGDRLLILGTTVSAELIAAGLPDRWTVRNLEPTDEMKRRTEALYTPQAAPLEGGVFEVTWRERRLRPGVIQHRQYLKAVESGVVLLIDTRLETID